MNEVTIRYGDEKHQVCTFDEGYIHFARWFIEEYMHYEEGDAASIPEAKSPVTLLRAYMEHVWGVGVIEEVK